MERSSKIRLCISRNDHRAQKDLNDAVAALGQLGVGTGTFNHPRHASQRYASHAHPYTRKKKIAKTIMAFGHLRWAKEFRYPKPKLAKTGYVYRGTRDTVLHKRGAKTLEPGQIREKATNTTTSWRSKSAQGIWGKALSRRSYPLLRSIAGIPTPPDALE